MAGISATQYSKRLQTLTKPVLRNLMYQEIKEDEIMLRGLKAKELLEGKLPNGKQIGTYRSPSYSLFKQRINPLAGGKVDLVLTGAFAESAYLLKPKNNIYGFGFSDKKATSLLARYGKDVGGLNQQTFNRFVEIQVAEHFIKAMKQYAKI